MRDEFDEFMEKLCGALRDAWEIKDEKWEALRKDVEPKKRSENLGNILCDPQYLGTGIMEKYFDSYVFTPRFCNNLGITKRYQYYNSCPQDIARFISPIKKSVNSGLCKGQYVDWCFLNNNNEPWMFFELESMDRAQIYLFADPVKNGKYWAEENDNKLWYYYWTVAKLYLNMGNEVPRYFVFFLCLPDDLDERAKREYKEYHWDYCKKYAWSFMGISLFGICPEDVYSSPFKFYWPKIKQLCREFLEEKMVWKCAKQPTLMENICIPKPVELKEFQDETSEDTKKKCELILIAYNCHKKLIVSRGKDQFDCTKDQVWSIETGEPERGDARENPQKL